jgi:carotenoid cleavage dioxygenase-like enzyme
MAHVLHRAPVYVNGKKASEQVLFPNTPVFRGFQRPPRIEGDIFDLEVEGELPKEISGTFYRVQPDHRFPPVFEEDIQFSGDGNITAIRIENGHADLKQRYVQTERFKAETAARKALFGKYRNPYTDSEAVKGIIRTVSNTNIIFWRGTLLALKEDGPPSAMDPTTLETIGRYDFEGQILAPTFTAHPKFDPDTGEMVAFAYEAGGNGHDASCDIAVWTIDKDGRKTEECWYKAPFCGMIHDCSITKNYLILPLTAIKCNLDRLKEGGNHFAWDPNEDQLYGIVPRRNGKPEDIRWYRGPSGFHGHFAGSYEDEDGNIVADLTVATGNVFVWFPPDPKVTPPGSFKPPERNELKSPTTRWVFDPKAPTDTFVNPQRDLDNSGEFARIDERFMGRRYSQFWQLLIDPTRPYDAQKCGPPAGGLFNCLGHFNWDTGTRDIWFAGPTSTLQEPVFIPKKDSDEEGVGWVICFANRLDENRNDILLFEAHNIEQGPIVIIHLPMRLGLGIHGNWVDQSEIEAFAKRRAASGDLGPLKIAEQPLPWQQNPELRKFDLEVNGYGGGKLKLNGVV